MKRQGVYPCRLGMANVYLHCAHVHHDAFKMTRVSPNQSVQCRYICAFILRLKNVSVGNYTQLRYNTLHSPSKMDQTTQLSRPRCMFVTTSTGLFLLHYPDFFPKIFRQFFADFPYDFCSATSGVRNPGFHSHTISHDFLAHRNNKKKNQPTRGGLEPRFVPWQKPMGFHQGNPSCPPQSYPPQ